MDNFIILCFVAVFAALVEFACINFIDTFVKNTKERIAAEKAKEEEEKQKAKKKLEEAVVSISELSTPATLLEYDKNSLLLPLVEITEERKFLTMTTSEETCIIHFFHEDFRRCAIMDNHLKVSQCRVNV